MIIAIVAVIYAASLVYTFADYRREPADWLCQGVDVGLTALLSPFILIGGLLSLIFGPLEEI